MAYNLQEAITKQAIKEAEMQIKVEERTKQIQVQEQEMSRREKELEAQVCFHSTSTSFLDNTQISTFYIDSSDPEIDSTVNIVYCNE